MPKHASEPIEVEMPLLKALQNAQTPSTTHDNMVRLVRAHFREILITNITHP